MSGQEARTPNGIAANLNEESVSSPMWEILMEKLDRAWTENRIDLHTYQILLEALGEAEAQNRDIEGA